MLTKNELMLLSGLIYKVYTIRDLREMRESLLEAIRPLIGYDMATFELASEDKPYHVSDPVGIGTSRKSMQHYLDEVQEYDYGRWTYAAPSGGVYRESDFMPDDKRVNTPYYQNFFKPEGVHYSLMLVIIKSQTFYGCLALFRSRESGDFTEREAFILNLLQDHIGYRLESEKKSKEQMSAIFPDQSTLIAKYGLTLRESEITNLLLRGLSVDMICDQLSITPNTLKKHRANIYKKIGINSAGELLKLLKT